jgi:bacillithiol biosynthesis deacetylase BshB1
LPEVDALVVGPHPDDAELFCGGLLANLVAAGHKVGILDLTRGELASRGTPAIRAQEAQAAATVLGLTVRAQAKLPDGFVSANDAEQVREVVWLLRQLRPALLVYPFHHDRHPDHTAASQLLDRAVFLAGLRNYQATPFLPWQPRQVLLYPMREDGPVSMVVDITATYATKQAAIACHSSQVGPVQEQEGAPLIATSASHLALQTRDAWWGAMIGAHWGEPYISRSPLALRDPLGHLQQLDLAPPQLFPSRQ